MNEELRRLFEQDQGEREDHPAYGTPAYVELRKRDAERRGQVREMLARGEVKTPEDSFRAAMVLQHGEEIDEVRQAGELARQSAEAGFRPARWLAAAALDRWLMYRGLPQKYGTQIVPDGVRQRVWDVDPATSDAERAEWDVPSLAEMERRAAEVTRTEPMPPMDEAPEWLRQAVRRWRAEDSTGPP